MITGDTPRRPPRRLACVLPSEGADLVGLRLARLRDDAAATSPGALAALWDALHQMPITFTARWLVLPASVVVPPGHIELFLLARSPAGSLPPSFLDQLLALLASAFPAHGFEPLGSPSELHFSREPLGSGAWSCFLAPRGAGGQAHAVGFDTACASTASIRTPLVTPGEADLGRALQLLAAWPVATALDWSFTPLRPGRRELEQLRRQARGEPGMDERSFFECTITWRGATGDAPLLLGASLAHALGVEQGRFELAPVPRPFVAAQGSTPAFLPPAHALRAISPVLHDPTPVRLPGVSLPRAGTMLGTTVDGRTVRLPQEDGLRHVWCLGQTGVGKSTLMLRRILEILEEGRSGVAVFAPHPELVEALRHHMPASRREDVVEVDVSDALDSLPGLNLLECGRVADAHVRAGQALEMISSLWPREMCGPMFLQAATNALLLLAARFEEPGTLSELPRVFLDAEFRNALLEAPGVADRVPEAARWWTKGYAKYSDFTKSESMDYYIAKFGIFATDPVLRAIVGKRRSTLDLRRIMDGRGVLLCSLGRSGVNPLATALLTAVFMNGTLNAALSRADLPPEERTGFFVHADEFQHIAGPSTAAMLSELRKYNVGLFLAHQFIDQLPEDVVAAVLGNVGTKITFRVGARDALRLSAFQPALSVEELVRLPNFTAMAELLVEGVPTGPFTLLTPDPLPDPPARARARPVPLEVPA